MITILMAAYNGEKYIGEQIQSILDQTYQDWKLVIQDDCSIDATFNIASDYAEKYPGKITAVRRPVNSGSAMNNFFSMLSFADDPYIMLSDQDDVWMPDKIMVSIERMKELENTNGEEIPLLVHSDLVVVDDALHKVDKSFLKMQKLDNHHSSLNCMLAQNIVTGCTTMVNKKLIEMIGEPPAHAVMHDWWMALIATAFGVIGFVETPTVLYRQHISNAVGAKRTGSLKHYMSRLFYFKQLRKEMAQTYLQAKEFAKIFGHKLDPHMKQMIEDFASLPSKSIIQRYNILKRYSLWKTGALRKLAQIFIV